MFKENSKAIYLQIADRIQDDILSGAIAPGDRLPSVREYAARVQVNPNTMVRAYEYLASLDIIRNKRGIGYFLAEEAPRLVRELRAEDFLGSEIYEMFRRLRQLGISPELLKNKYEEYIAAPEQ